MSQQSKIEWTHCTWNPITGCTKVSPGCKHCYAEVMTKRLQAIGIKGYKHGFDVITTLPERLEEPLRRKKPTTYFVNSMSDLFHEKVSDKFIVKVFDIMSQTPHHTFQILTKRAKRMAKFIETYKSTPNIWLGVSVEDRQYGIPRIDILRTIPVSVRFLSIEPLLENLGALDLSDIHWVIVGGESGPKARAMQEQWVVSIQKQCQQQKVPFFFKQWGSWGADGQKRSKKENGRILGGQVWNEMPKQMNKEGEKNEKR